MRRSLVPWVLAIIVAFGLGGIAGSAWTNTRMQAAVRHSSMLAPLSKIELCADALLILEQQNPVQVKLLLEGELWHSMNSALAFGSLSGTPRSVLRDRHRPLLQARRYFKSQELNTTVPEDLLDQLEAVVNSEHSRHSDDAG